MNSKEPPSTTLEKQLLREESISYIAGIDEAGRGPWAGPVVVVSCILLNFSLPSCEVGKIRESKEMSKKKREQLFVQLVKSPDLYYGVGIASHSEIDATDILSATGLAADRSIEALPLVPDYLLIDGKHLKSKMAFSIPYREIVRGDQKVLTIAIASILAKVTRDKIMAKYDRKFPHYHFDQHKGYGTAMHQRALLFHGICPIHRKSFSPIKKLIKES